MKKHILKIRKVDKIVFDLIKDGKKTIETRAGTDKYRNIKVGDILVLVCGKDKIQKQVKKITIFNSIDEMIDKIDFKKIMPFIASIEEMKKVYYSFPNYREKIGKCGLVAFDLL